MIYSPYTRYESYTSVEKFVRCGSVVENHKFGYESHKNHTQLLKIYVIFVQKLCKKLIFCQTKNVELIQSEFYKDPSAQRTSVHIGNWELQETLMNYHKCIMKKWNLIQWKCTKWKRDMALILMWVTSTPSSHMSPIN